MEIEGAFFNTADYELQNKKLGQGASGTIYVAKNLTDNQEYAAKIINIDENFDGNAQLVFLRESLLLYKLNHPSIVKFIGLNFKSFHDPSIFQPTIITEYLKHGSLKVQLKKERNGISDCDWTPTKKYITLIGVSDAMRYLHANKIIHRDLKPENILVDDNYCPRVCDFGLSKCLPELFTKSKNLTMTGQIGTPLYMAPELLLGEGHYDSSIDVYAFSMLAYEIVSGEEPFSELFQSNTSPYQFMNQVIGGYRPKRVAGITDKMWNLLCNCWSANTNERPTFEYIFNELKNDRKYFFESIDEDELVEYLEKLSENENHRRTNPKDEYIMKIKSELNELKIKMQKYEDERNKLSLSNINLYSALVSIVGPKKSRNINRAIQELTFASSKGNRYASFILGLLYEAGEDVECDMNKSIMYYEASGKQGNSSGFNRIGLCYENGIGLPQNNSKALEYYRKAADFDDPSAIRNIGCFYNKGKEVEKDYSKAIEYFEKAAKLGSSSALNNLALAYANGKGVKQDYSKAIEYFVKAAKLGNENALNNLANAYVDGKGVKKDYSKAIEYYEKAINLGCSKAKKNLEDLQQKMK